MLQKPFVASPCCMGSVFFVLPMQRGDVKNVFCNTSAARMLCFQFVSHVLGGKAENHEIRFFKKHEIQKCAFGCCGEQHSVETPTPAIQPIQPSEANSKTTTTPTTTTITINKFGFRTSRDLRAHRGNVLGPWAFSRGRCLMHLQVFPPKANGCIRCGAIM